MHIAKGTWVLAADGGRILLFRNEGNATDPVLVTQAHEDLGNPPSHGQGSDTPGRSFSSDGVGRSSYEETDWHRQAKQDFATHAAAILDSATMHDKAAIVVIAPPQTLGELRKHYGAGVAGRLRAEIAKDLTGHVTGDIVDAILAHVN